MKLLSSSHRAAYLGLSLLGLTITACGGGNSSGNSGGGGSDGGSGGGATTPGRTWDVEQITTGLTTVAANTNPGTSQVSITIQGDTRVIAANNIPNHNVGSFPNGDATAQNNVYRLDATPTLSGGTTYLQLGDMFGVAVNGVTFDPLAAEFYEKGGTDWNYVVLNGAINLRPDTQFGHIQGGGEYHYHGIAQGLLDNIGYSAAAHSPLVGYAADGFPIYALTDSSGAVSPSYRLKSGNRPGGDNAPGGFYDGAFHADYEYVNGRGDLDECNGKTTSGPDGSGGTYTGYAYFLTGDYPVIPICLKGSVSSNVSAASLFEPCRDASCVASTTASRRQDAGAVLTAQDQMLFAREGFDHLSDRSQDAPGNDLRVRLFANGIDASASLGNSWLRLQRLEVTPSEAALVGGGEGTFTQVSAGQDLRVGKGPTVGVLIGAEQGEWTLGNEANVVKDGLTLGLYGGQDLGDALHVSAYLVRTGFDNALTSTSGASANVASARTLVSTRIAGEMLLDSGILVRPALELGAGEERIEAYSYSDGTFVPADSAGFTSIALGGEVEFPMSKNQSQILLRGKLEQLAATGDVRLSDGTILVASDQTSGTLGITWKRALDEDRSLALDLEVSGLGGDGEESASLALDYEGAF